MNILYTEQNNSILQTLFYCISYWEMTFNPKLLLHFHKIIWERGWSWHHSKPKQALTFWKLTLCSVLCSSARRFSSYPFKQQKEEIISIPFICADRSLRNVINLTSGPILAERRVWNSGLLKLDCKELKAAAC